MGGGPVWPIVTEAAAAEVIADKDRAERQTASPNRLKRCRFISLLPPLWSCSFYAPYIAARVGCARGPFEAAPHQDRGRASGSSGGSIPRPSALLRDAMAGAGAPLRSLMEWMGHADLATTLRYADYSPRPGAGWG